MDQVGEEGHASRRDEDHRLDRGGGCQDRKAYRDRPDPVPGFDDRSIYEAMRVTMTPVFVIVLMAVAVVAKSVFMGMWPLDVARRRVAHRTRITVIVQGTVRLGRCRLRRLPAWLSPCRV